MVLTFEYNFHLIKLNSSIVYTRNSTIEVKDKIYLWIWLTVQILRKKLL